MEKNTKKEGTSKKEIIEYGLELSEVRHPTIVREKTYYSTDGFMNPSSIDHFFRSELNLNKKAEEKLYMIALSSSGEVLGLFEVSHGTMTKTFCGIKEIASRLLLCGAVNTVLVHNHPSGSLQPSFEDERIVDRLNEVTSMLDIKLLDFIIIGDSGFYSFAENHQIG